MKMCVKRLTETAILPSKGSEYSAGLDLYTDQEPVTIQPHQRHMFHTGIAVEIPDGFFGGVYARSGLAIKEGLRPSNCVGVIDSDYRGEIMVGITNDSNTQRYVGRGERIAQLIIQPYVSVELEDSESLSWTERGEYGIGSTGKN